MSGALVVPLEPDVGPSTGQMREVLSTALERQRPGVRIVDIERAPCPYGTSWWLEELTLELSDNTRTTLVFKDLLREAKGSGARQVKPAFVSDPARESWVYRNVLMHVAGPPILWAAVNDFAAERHWLFMERVNGAPLTEVGDRDAWCAAAEWLGRFHATVPVQRAECGPLLRHDHEYHRRWMVRALSATQEREKLARLRALESVHQTAIAVALATTVSVIHGEFYPSNVLVEQSWAVHAVDWEMAALGPALFDLAALISGRWSSDDRIAMATAYREGAESAGMRCPVLEELLLGVTACRLLLAVQWLGWAADWTAPAGHQNDWLEEVELCARELR